MSDINKDYKYRSSIKHHIKTLRLFNDLDNSYHSMSSTHHIKSMWSLRESVKPVIIVTSP